MSLIEQNLDDNGIFTLTLNRPDKLNAMSTDVLHTLSELFASAKDNKKVKAILLTGAGKAFCAGADINRLAECDAQSGYQFACFGQDVFRQLETLGKPSLAAVNGYAFGGGCELAMAATLRIAAREAQFGQPEVKLGVIPGYGGTQRLARLVGKGRALDLCLTGRFIDAQTALNWGLVNDVVNSEQLIEEGRRLLKGILSMAPLAIAGVMEVIDRGYDLSLPDALHLEAVHFANVCASEDKTEGVRAFLEKRKPAFKAR
ncbi:enoyl-CoA hydratase/isomerase family protein [Legionella nagasakiensis]|uniref:enoyl-CoA hydratase/isomerase family protein n=1 Tax=Legionella nagasakiensis TaxID=535290 RepID=UPI00105423C7|nr:enoyl-CoA hydratase-related protein [Legionella nagasakiensis]